MKCYYTYVWSCNDVPFYVGKGSGNRALSHLNTDSKLAGIIQTASEQGREIRCQIFPAVSERAALDYEVELITKYGRLDIGTGFLLNKSPGGTTAPSKPRSLETRRRISEGHRGTKRSDETRRRISEAKKNPSAETRAKLSKINKGKKFTEEHRQKMSAAHKGRVFTEEHRKKIAEAKRRKREEKRRRPQKPKHQDDSCVADK